MARGSLKTLHDASGNVRGFRLKYDLPPHPGTGKRRQQNETLHRRPGETVTSLRKRADGRLAEALAALDAGVPVVDRTITLASYLTERWLPHYQTTVRPTSYWQREWAVRCWIVPRIGAVKLGKLRALTIQDAYTQMRAAGLSTASLESIHGTLSAALAQAVKWDILVRNPCAGVSLPTITPTRTVRALTPEEANALLTTAHAVNDFYADLYEFAILTQLRIGELVALRWQDVDLPTSVIRVEQTATRSQDRTHAIGPPKTKGSRRIVWLDEWARELLVRQRTRQDDRRHAAGDYWIEHDLVFDRGDGADALPGVVREALHRTAGRAGLTGVTPHTLRHTGLTWMGKVGTNPIVAGDRAGHQSLTMTRHYTHASASWQQEPAVAVARLLHEVGSTAVPRTDELVEKP